MRLKLWLASEFTLAVLFYYMAYIIATSILGDAKPYIEVQIFCATWMFLFGTAVLINFVMSLMKGKANAFVNRFGSSWFSVHKLLRRR